MLYVRVELWPRGDQRRAEVLGEARIWNTGRGTWTRGEYKAAFQGRRGAPLGGTEVHDHPRTRLLAWDLLLRALVNLRGERNGVSLGPGAGSER